MSMNILRLIPTDPRFAPEPSRRRAALELLAGMVRNRRPDALSDEVRDEVGLVDSGVNTRRISCPECEAELTDWWWSEAIDAAYRTECRELDVTLPCCGTRRSLNDLNYDWPMGFARYVLAAEDPEVRGLDAGQIQALEDALGCKLRIIWAHY